MCVHGCLCACCVYKRTDISVFAENYTHKYILCTQNHGFLFTSLFLARQLDLFILFTAAPYS